MRALLVGRREVHLAFDPTPQAGHATLLIVGIVVHRRILPAAWRAVPQQRRWPERQIVPLRAMCQQIAAAPPSDARATLLRRLNVTPHDLLICCANVVAHANWLRKEALDRGDQSPSDAMLCRVDGIYVLVAMFGLGIQWVRTRCPASTPLGRSCTRVCSRR